MNRIEQRALARKRTAELIAWLESGVSPTADELAAYAIRLAAYDGSGRQHGLPFDAAIVSC